MLKSCGLSSTSERPSVADEISGAHAPACHSSVSSLPLDPIRHTLSAINAVIENPDVESSTPGADPNRQCKDGRDAILLFHGRHKLLHAAKTLNCPRFSASNNNYQSGVFPEFIPFHCMRHFNRLRKG